MLRMDPLLPLHAVSAAVALTVAVLAWRRRATTPLAGTLAAEMTVLAGWTAAGSFAASVTVPAPAEGATLLVPPLAALAATGVFVLCRQMHTRTWTPDRRAVVLLGLEPALITVLALTDRWHGAVLADVRFTGTPPVLTATLGWAFWLHTLYCYLLIAAGIGYLLRAWRQGRPFYRRQVATMLVAQVVPVLGNLVWLLTMTGGRPVGDTPVLFVVSALLMSWAVFRQGLLRIVPVARQLVLEQVGEVVVVLGPSGIVVDHNTALRRLVDRLPDRPGELVGRDIRDVLGPGVDLAAGSSGRLQLTLRDGTAELDYRLTVLRDRSGRSLGVVAVARDVTAQVRQAQELAEANARLRSQVQTIERLRAELAEQAVRDELTGLHNRRHLVRQWGVELDRCRRAGRELTVLVLDADRFKQINDEHGHPTGDQVLVALAQTLAEALRPSDLLARYGGEEFVALLPGLGGGTALRRAEELRSRCSQIRVPAPTGPLGITVSIGVAVFPQSGTEPERLLEAADQALYRAKQEGRDRVELHRPHADRSVDRTSGVLAPALLTPTVSPFDQEPSDQQPSDREGAPSGRRHDDARQDRAPGARPGRPVDSGSGPRAHGNGARPG